METLPNFIKRKHPRKGEKKKQGGKGCFSLLLVLKIGCMSGKQDMGTKEVGQNNLSGLLWPHPLYTILAYGVTSLFKNAMGLSGFSTANGLLWTFGSLPISLQ
jgi:hypothetical protein